MFASAVLDAMLARLMHLFLSAAGGDEPAARQTAHQSLLAYHPRSEAELALTAAIISFSFHALDALNRSADPDLTITQVCRLRSNAVSLSREAHKAQRKLDQFQKSEPAKEAPPSEEKTATAPAASRPPGQTWTQAYYQRQREKRLAERAHKANLRNAASASPEPAPTDASRSNGAAH